MRLTALLCIIATGAVAQDCPTAADLESGIVVRDTSSGSAFEFREVDGQFFRTEVFLSANGQTTGLVDKQDHFLFMPHDLPLFGVRYQPPVRDIAQLFEDGEWRNRISEVMGHSARRRGVHHMQVLEESTYTIGSCSYLAYRIEDTITLGDEEAHSFERIYAPELGFVVARTGLLSVFGGYIQSGYAIDEFVAE